MPFLLDVAPEHIIGINPFGPFNRFIMDPIGIYLESGALNMVNLGFLNPEAYKPALFASSAKHTPINKAIQLETALEPSGNCQVEVIKDVKNSFKQVSGVESLAVGCAKKTHELQMVDPRGVVQESSNTGGEQESEEAPYCPSDIIYRKYSQVLFPPSMFTGKLKLYIQSIYGSGYVKYALQPNGDSWDLQLGEEAPTKFAPPTVKETVKRIVLTNKERHTLYTDSKYNYYLISTAGMRINKLEPNEVGKKLQRYLVENTGSLSDKEINAYEAYILATCLPTTYIDSSNGGDILGDVNQTYGLPYDFGWHANWKGDQLSQVGIKTQSSSSIKTGTVVTLSVELSNSDGLYEDEKLLKMAQLRSQQKGDTATQTGVVRIYATKAYFTELDTENECLVGDIEIGAWYYITQGDEESLEEQVEEKNKHWGGLPYSEEFFTALGAQFIFNLSEGDQGEFLEPIQQDKIFTWNDYYGLYEWHIPYEPNSVLAPDTFPSADAPVYCFYDKDDALKVVYYHLHQTDESDNENQPTEFPCGSGSWHGCTITRGTGYSSGFSVGGTSLQKRHSGGVIASSNTGNLNSSGGGSWGASCGSAGVCDGEGAGPSENGIPFFFTHWVRAQSGKGESTSHTVSGSQVKYTFLVIPKNDCESVFIGQSYRQSGTESYSKSSISGGVSIEQVSITNTGWKKITAGDAEQGWLTCNGMYFSKVYGGTKSESGAWVNIDKFGPPFDSTKAGKETFARKWGPDGEDGPSRSGQLSGAFSVDEVLETRAGDYESKFVEAHFIGRSGSVTLIQKSAGTVDIVAACPTGSVAGTPDAELEGWGAFSGFSDAIPLKTPYVGGGLHVDSRQTTQGLAVITSPVGRKTIPEEGEWPFPDDYTSFVGYI